MLLRCMNIWIDIEGFPSPVCVDQPDFAHLACICHLQLVFLHLQSPTYEHCQRSWSKVNVAIFTGLKLRD